MNKWDQDKPLLKQWKDNPNCIWSVKHGGGSVMALACMAGSGTGSLIFIDDVTNDGSSRMNSEVYRNILSAYVQENASKLIRWRFTMQSMTQNTLSMQLRS